MNTIKSCPSCNRSYSDLTLSFCLEDGSRLFDSLELKEDKGEETVVRSSSDRDMGSDYLKRHSEFVANHDKIVRKFAKTERTEKEYPILNSEPVFKGPASRTSSSDYIRKITFEITELHTDHAQENLVILREYFNEFVIDKGNKLLVNSTMQNGVAKFYTRSGQRFTYDFQKKNSPTKEDFLKALHNFLN